jgi:hypothetical protein
MDLHFSPLSGARLSAGLPYDTQKRSAFSPSADYGKYSLHAFEEVENGEVTR